MKVLFVGDVYGTQGEQFLIKNLGSLKKTYQPNLIFVNGENISHNGRGIGKDTYRRLMTNGISAITMGNWTFGNPEILEFINESNIIRPCNYKNAPGNGYLVIQYNQKKVLVINALGRTYVDYNLENPFTVIKNLIDTVEHDYVIVDFHAEATSEKVALGHFLDGFASAVLGTHTHIPTADECVLEKGTLYITDIGMTGPNDGVIGVEKEIVINRFLNGYTVKNKVAQGRLVLNAVIMDLDLKTISRIRVLE